MRPAHLEHIDRLPVCVICKLEIYPDVEHEVLEYALSGNPTKYRHKYHQGCKSAIHDYYERIIPQLVRAFGVVCVFLGGATAANVVNGLLPTWTLVVDMPAVCVVAVMLVHGQCWSDS